MKRIKLWILSLILTFAAPVATIAASTATNLATAEPASAASDPSLAFSSATFDYYLEKTADGTKMKVKETYEAAFSPTSTSHGLTRVIPYTNQNGKNVTIDNLNIKVTRNGNDEPIDKIEKSGDGYYTVYIGSASKTVQGAQTYVLEYEFENVITEFDKDGNNISGEGKDTVAWQELYWDTNGTGWSNVFHSLTANVHMSSEILKNVNDQAYCYTGRLGSNAQNCTIEKTSDGFTFTATEKLNAYENLTFALEFTPGTFTVKKTTNYILLGATALALGLGIIICLAWFKKYQKFAKPKKAYAAHLLTAPQYLPPKDLTIAEAGEIYISSSKHPTQTATLLELAISHKIQLIAEKSESKILKREQTTWKIKVLEGDNYSLTAPELGVLKMISGEPNINPGDEFKIEKHAATPYLASVAENYPINARKMLQEKKYLEDAVRPKTGRNDDAFSNLGTLLIVAQFALTMFTLVLGDKIPGNVFGDPGLRFGPAIIFAITVIIITSLYHTINKYAAHTESGLELSNYLAGLELYVKMAEKDRLKFNQSTKGAPKDDKGVVRLYEKLLPYAVLFGVEESWLKELQGYYDHLNYSPDWYNGTDMFTYGMIYSMLGSTRSNITSSTTYHDSSSSSGSSGGGGGGFSGGGGGGGGGGSW